jgi:hypothetical protein
MKTKRNRLVGAVGEIGSERSEERKSTYLQIFATLAERFGTVS